jgi:hypothetical protein
MHNNPACAGNTTVTRNEFIGRHHHKTTGTIGIPGQRAHEPGVVCHPRQYRCPDRFYLIHRHSQSWIRDTPP